MYATGESFYPRKMLDETHYVPPTAGHGSRAKGANESNERYEDKMFEKLM